jgi:hypothetical protein
VTPGRLPAAPLLAAAATCLAAAIGVQIQRDRAYQTDLPATQVLYVQSPDVARRMALSYDTIAADVYWLRAIQHFGGTRRATTGEKNYELLYPLLDMATGLDPHFNIAYRFGAIFLSQPKPGGPGRPDLAEKLLLKGLKASPTKWEYMHDIGFVHYWARHDYKAAAEWFERGSRLPNAPWFLKPLAAVTLTKGGQRSTSRVLFQALAQSGDSEWIRTDAQRRLRQLDAMDAIDARREVVARCRARGASASTWPQLVRAGCLRAVPLDPDGFAFELDPSSGDVRLGNGSTLAPLPDAPGPDAPTVAPAPRS